MKAQKSLTIENWSIENIKKEINELEHIYQVKVAVFSAEKVIGIFENEYPDDKRPRLAIEATKEFIKNPTKENRQKCKDAAADAYAAYTDADADAYVADAVANSYAAAAYAAAYTDAADAYAAYTDADAYVADAVDAATYAATYAAAAAVYADAADAYAAYTTTNAAYATAAAAKNDKLKQDIINYINSIKN